MNKPRRERRKVDGWLVLDKPLGLTSTHALSVVKRLFQADKAGHAGTLDPLASGILPLAFGEATKTVPFVMDGEKSYRFTVRWGIETDTDDADGKPVATSDVRPNVDAIETILPAFIGTISQQPPLYSALKVAGERAYDLARSGEAVVLEPRLIEVRALRLVAADVDAATFEAECGKGTYVRALARDFGRVLGCHGHVSALRRTRVGPFAEADALPLAALQDAGVDGPLSEQLLSALMPVETALAALPSLAVTAGDAERLKSGRSIILRGRDAPIVSGLAYVTCRGRLVALVEGHGGELLPKRAFHLG